MRRGVGVIVALGFGLGLAQSASAADYGPLRGSSYDAPRGRDWSGFSVGGHVGVGSGGANFNGAGSSLIQSMIAHTNLESEGVQNWATAGKADTGYTAEFGGFIGINGQWGDVVLGVEASYHRVKVSAESSGRTPSDGSFILMPDGDFYSVPTAVSGQSYISLTDFGTIRGRVGWAVDYFLPYVTGGVAIGRASYGTTANLYRNAAICVVADCSTATNPWPNDAVGTAGEAKSNALIYGWTIGFGMDWALTDNIFVRGEYEFVQFSQMKLNLNNARVGLGLKF